MCENCKKGSCAMGSIAKILVIIGGINWGFVGLGMLIGKSWNLVDMILGSMPTILTLVYILVGISAVMMIFGCKCNKCMSGVCKDEKMEEKI